MTKDIIVYTLRANGHCCPRTVSAGLRGWNGRRTEVRIARFPFGTDCAGLPEQTLLLGANLSPHQVLFDDFAASAPQKEAPCFSTGIFAF